MTTAPLAGLRIVEVSSFVASPLCGLTLAQLGAEVIRVDPPGGAADYTRWPVAESGRSIYWTGLNKGKKSVVCDMRTETGQRQVQELVTASGAGGGILVTNAGGRSWLSHATLAALRPDVITVEILGKRDGLAAVDYTVNAGIGFPSVTGPEDHGGVSNHVLPAWDVACGLYAALAVVSAVRRRDRGGVGAEVTIPLDDVALAVTSTLGYLTEAQVNHTGRDRIGNFLYGAYGFDFRTGDDGRIMVVALTTRHFRDLVAVTETGTVIAALEGALPADFASEQDRYRHRELLTTVFAPWFAKRTTDDALAALKQTSVLHQRYRTFAQAVVSDDVQHNPMFGAVTQPGVGTYLAAAHPARFDGCHFHVGPAAEVGDDTDHVVADRSSTHRG